MALSSNLNPSALDQVMDKNVATALADRLLHHAHVVVTAGNSVRLQDATSGKGVVPLTGRTPARGRGDFSWPLPVPFSWPYRGENDGRTVSHSVAAYGDF